MKHYTAYSKQCSNSTPVHYRIIKSCHGLLVKKKDARKATKKRISSVFSLQKFTHRISWRGCSSLLIVLCYATLFRPFLHDSDVSLVFLACYCFCQSETFCPRHAMFENWCAVKWKFHFDFLLLAAYPKIGVRTKHTRKNISPITHSTFHSRDNISGT